MTDAALASPAAPKKRGPNTPEGKARARMNALKHGLRAREFGLLPEENQAEWAEHVRDLRAGYGPVDATEEKLVAAIAVAMWKEIRADRVETDVMRKIAPSGPGRSHGTDMSVSEHRLSLGTAIRYASATGMATQRAQRAFLAHRKAKRAGLILPAIESVPDDKKSTNDFVHGPHRSSPSPANDAGTVPSDRTNDLSPIDQPSPPALRSDRRIVAFGARSVEQQAVPLLPPHPGQPPRTFDRTLMHGSAMLAPAGMQAGRR